MVKNNIIVICVMVVCSLLFYFFGGIQKESKPPTSSAAVKQIGFYHYYSGDLSGGISEMINEVNKGQTRFNVSARALDHEAFKSMIHTTLDKGTHLNFFPIGQVPGYRTW